MGRPIAITHSSSSSIDSTSTLSDDDLTLALTISPPHTTPSTQISRTAFAHDWRTASLFVKVYMEGIPIGRKLDLLAHSGYHALITPLARMFNTNILWPNADRVHSEKHHVLTYEDKEGDWLLVGDVPWEMFLNTVRRLKITRADRC